MCNNKNIIEVNEKDKIEEDEIGNGKMEEEMWWNIEKVMRWKMNGESKVIRRYGRNWLRKNR